MDQGHKIFDKTITRANYYDQKQSNPINARKTSNRLYGGYKNTNKLPDLHNNVNIVELLNEFCNEVSLKKTTDEIVNCLNSIAINKLGYSFTAGGIVNSHSKYLNIKLKDFIGNTYSTRILLSETQNPIVDCFFSKTKRTVENFDMLSVPYIQTPTSLIYPMVYQAESIGVFVAGSPVNSQQNNDILSVLINYLTIAIVNKELSQKVCQEENLDGLTGFRNHRDFHEKLTLEIQKAESTSGNFSVLMFDINNISQINREYGHAKGDEIIAMVAEQIRQNIRDCDIAARYGGDEIAIILPDTDNKDACKIGEYLSYNVSCLLIDDIGTVKVSTGVSTYPSCSRDQEKLMLLAEQAMLISKNKGYEKGTCPIVSAQTIDFWNEMALDSLASVIAKRHSQWGINYEDELVKKFQSDSSTNNNHIMEVITSLAGAIDAKDPYTKGHSHCVSKYAEALARTLNLPDASVERIKLGAMLHDVGKIGIPESVLRKPEPLNDQEWEIMKQHPKIGAKKVLAPIGSLQDLIPMVEFHHENWNGSGYPNALKGEEIPLEARIVAIADSFHALVSDRPYRKALSVEEAINILRAGAGIQWDKNLVRKFITIAPSLCTQV